jgi:hypothetical protein
MGRREELVELAALLDGELDDSRAEQLYARMQADPELMAEFEAQRQVKRALGQLSEVEAPNYIATRVMGEIGARRGQVAAWRWRTAAAAIGGFAVCLLLVGGFLYLNQQRPVSRPADMMLGSGEYYTQPSLSREALSREALPAEPMYGVELGELVLPEDVDAQTAAFLEFVYRAHGYQGMLNSAEALRPDLPAAILVLEGHDMTNGNIILARDEGER